MKFLKGFFFRLIIVVPAILLIIAVFIIVVVLALLGDLWNILINHEKDYRSLPLVSWVINHFVGAR